MAVTETVKVGWGSRLGSSMKGVLVGLVLFVAGFPVLFWNEGNTVKTRKALDEGEGACVSVESADAVDPAFQGTLVHMSAKADTSDVLSDAEFGISTVAIKLVREVEMYQWHESSHTTEKKNVGGSVTKTTTYEYSKGWSSFAIDSSNFKEAGHDNPGRMEFESASSLAAQVKFGAFRLSKSQIERIGSSQPYAFAADYACPVEGAQKRGALIYVPEASSRLPGAPVREVAAAPHIGDMRVTFRVVLPHEISIVAKQHGDTFVPYVAKNGQKISLLAEGVKDSTEMFADAQSANDLRAWLVRLGGFLLMYIGIGMILKPLSVLADVLPILGNIVELGAGIVAFAVAAPCALVTIAIAWLVYRPIVGIALLALAFAIVWWVRSKKQPKAATTPSVAKMV